MVTFSRLSSFFSCRLGLSATVWYKRGRKMFVRTLLSTVNIRMRLHGGGRKNERRNRRGSSREMRWSGIGGEWCGSAMLTVPVAAQWSGFHRHFFFLHLLFHVIDTVPFSPHVVLVTSSPSPGLLPSLSRFR
jgi:hypothetical protein